MSFLLTHTVSCCIAADGRISRGKRMDAIKVSGGSSVDDCARSDVVSLSKNYSRSNFRDKAIASSFAVANLVAIGNAGAVSSEKLLEDAGFLYTLAEGNIGDGFGGFLYSAGQQANEAVQGQLTALSFTRTCN
ncbi:hypothetical protein LINGRAPRIM_LOCUS2278 [Linum grandiflorum]